MSRLRWMRVLRSPHIIFRYDRARLREYEKQNSDISKNISSAPWPWYGRCARKLQLAGSRQNTRYCYLYKRSPTLFANKLGLRAKFILRPPWTSNESNSTIDPCLEVDTLTNFIFGMFRARARPRFRQPEALHTDFITLSSVDHIDGNFHIVVPLESLLSSGPNRTMCAFLRSSVRSVTDLWSPE